uniref:NADH-ubiquinone oxidoreductase chain 2 n=3 Tax=Cyrtodactylus shwetaungorum TaxID=2283086 RepID=A0A345X1U0_9SAUR|nr:NADH dehydrogenase subunit 2 [Cyrtodactylus shwetaungorum]AXK16153.1 NADH dehydrogenase subunit 2 [Cyrtodactylus shwetaungorum]AXK16155.1 NADH dehydrogenase subunit 2 [Cyrtodactylus shwetaungorum]AXK16156.1 NADH dehydrogenase subunit 2 [Cyrtodactylus shwetaungorum]AXK16157.1 NADH dehydrogenase subunit 2 [Cyrtodactylus shwetaungorum]
MNPLIWFMLITSLTTSTIITMTSNHWLLAWLGLELNTLSILPMIMKPHHPRAAEATTKYFLIQAMAATMILLASITNAWQTGQWTISHTSPTATLLVTTAIMLKLGIAPVHLWYPQVLQGVTMNTALVISTWQKIAPLTLLYMTHHALNPHVLLLLGLTSAVLAGWAGLNQTQTRTIMAFSSIAHMGWLITALVLNPSLATLTLATYIITTIATFIPLAMTKTITDIGTTWPLAPTTITTTMVMLMSLGGLPPLTGFMPKWLVLKELTATGLTTLATLILMASLPSLFFYIRLAYLTMLTTPPATTNTEYKWRFKLFTPTHTSLTIMAAALMLPLTTTLYPTT